MIVVSVLGLLINLIAFGLLRAGAKESLILPRAYRLGRDALRILVESAPAHIDVHHVTNELEQLDEVVEAHDLHVWTITSGMDAMSVPLQVRAGADTHAVLDGARQVLRDRHHISHANVQIEPIDHKGRNLVQW